MQFNLNLENIKYTKIVYKDREENVHFLKAAIRSMSENELYACAKFEDGLDIETPQEVSVSFICENGLYRTNTILKSIENAEPYVFLTLKTPQGLEFQQNREYFRVRMEENVIMTFSDTVISCKTFDLSANGVRLKLEKYMHFPENVMLDILFTPKNIKTKAKFVRIDDEEGILKASFNFVHLDENSRDIISQKCIRKQLENKRNSKL